MKIIKDDMKLMPNTWYKLVNFVCFKLSKKNRAIVYSKGFAKGDLKDWNVK